MATRARRRPILTRAGLVVAASAWIVSVGCHRKSNVVEATVTPAAAARIPRDAARFEIDVVDDSTARFKPREALWVQPGQVAYVVDPMQRDALVARLRVESVWNGTAVALVTSQVTRVSANHVVLMLKPPVPWWRNRRFWWGTVLGGVVGGTLGGVIASQ